MKIVLRPADFSSLEGPEDVFGAARPLALEIGFGDGGFLMHLAGAHPAWNLLGADVSAASVARAYRRVQRAGRQHVRLFQGSGRFLLHHLLPPRSVQRVYVNFPDPWPKKRHRGRRLLQASFFRLLSTRLATGGALLLTTDHGAYFDAAREEAHATALFDVRAGAPPAATLQTKYARKWQAQNKPIFHAVFRKVAEAPERFPSFVSSSEETTRPMHHAVLKGELPTLSHVRKQAFAFAQGHVIVLEAFRPVGADGLLFLTRVEEADLTQDLLIEARVREAGAVYVGIRPFSQPLLTPGTRHAVRVVTEWLEAQGLEAVQRSY